jgi:hypothetical protein
MELEENCTCGARPIRLLISRTDKNYMRRFYKYPIGKLYMNLFQMQIQVPHAFYYFFFMLFIIAVFAVFDKVTSFQFR